MGNKFTYLLAAEVSDDILGSKLAAKAFVATVGAIVTCLSPKKGIDYGCIVFFWGESCEINMINTHYECGTLCGMLTITNYCLFNKTFPS